jgi:hydrogenase expression/formation protein HypC
MRIVEIDGFRAVAEVDGVRRETRLDLLPEVAVGDYVLVHAGLAIATVDPVEAEETLTILRQLADEIQ